jgi:hypothetical protein
MPKPELEFSPAENLGPWIPIPGEPGVYEKILSSDPEKMCVTRLLKKEPGSAGTHAIAHDFWEEIYIIEGSQWVGDQHYTKGMYACRPPGMKHGPFRTDEGCINLEFRYVRD